MPVYEFRFVACGRKFQVIESIKDYDPKKVKCAKCGSARVERIWSAEGGDRYHDRNEADSSPAVEGLLR